MPEMNRDRIWEKPRHSDQLEEMLASDSVWRDLFHPERVHKMWADAKAGRGRSNYEPLLLRIAWRVCFEDHLRVLGDRATRVPVLRHRPRRSKGRCSNANVNRS